MQDILNLDYINSLPQPFIAYFIGDKDFKFGWPVTDICVETGIICIDVCGLLEVKTISDVNVFVDGDGNYHEPDTFFIEETELKENIVENSKKHRWYDVIVAWANGEKIQYSEAGSIGWQDYKPFGDNAVPAFNSYDIEWRIKPKTCTKKYRMALVDMYGGLVVKEPYVKAVEVTNSSIETPAEYDIQGFICWIGDTVEVELEV